MNWQFEKERIFSENESNELLAETTFVKTGNREISINRTYVNPSLRGHGVAGKMLKVVAEYLRENDLKANATCSYAYAWLKRNQKSYSDIISDDFEN